MNNCEHHKDSCKTYIEQTKLLVTLASAFIIAPAVTYTLVPTTNILFLILSEILFVLSVISGYVVLATISGSQALNDYDVHRTATRYSSLFQLAFYIVGLIIFVIMIKNSQVKDISSENKQKHDLIISNIENGFEIKVNHSIIIFNNDTLNIADSCDNANNKEKIDKILIIDRK
jgi:hypothetical protein